MGLFNEEASRSAIRHFCQGIGDSNPLYWDVSYGQQSKFGTIIAPPCFLYSVYWCSGRTGGLPGVHGFHAGNDWEWYRPIYMDDKIFRPGTIYRAGGKGKRVRWQDSYPVQR